MRTILLIDDKESTREFVSTFLENQGYRMLTAVDGVDGWQRFEQEQPDLILLDLMMPRMDGFQFMQRLRKTSRVGVIVLTAKQHENDLIRSYDLGVDDYLSKPFRMRELLMRVRAVLRRTAEISILSHRYEVRELHIHTGRREVTVENQLVDLAPIEYLLLETLIASANNTFTHAQLSSVLIENGYTGSANTLKTHIRYLRQKIESDPKNPRYIETVFGVGYRLRTAP